MEKEAASVDGKWRLTPTNSYVEFLHGEKQAAEKGKTNPEKKGRKSTKILFKSR